MHQKDQQWPQRRPLTSPVLEAEAKGATVKKRPHTNTAQETEKQEEEFKEHPSEDVQILSRMLTKDIGCSKAHRE